MKNKWFEKYKKWREEVHNSFHLYRTEPDVVERIPCDAEEDIPTYVYTEYGSDLICHIEELDKERQNVLLPHLKEITKDMNKHDKYFVEIELEEELDPERE